MNIIFRYTFRMVGWSHGFVEFLAISKKAKSDHSKFCCAKVKANYVVCFLKRRSNRAQHHKQTHKQTKHTHKQLFILFPEPA